MDRKLPDGWRWVRFGDVVREVRAATRDPEMDGLTRVVGLEHLDSESLPLRRWNELADLPDGTSFTRVFRAGQVLFGKRRAYQRKVAVPDFDGICSGDILVFEPSTDDLLQDFLPYIVQSDGFFDHALGTSAGSLSPRTKWQELAKYEFALPARDDQPHIVEILAAADDVTDRGAVVMAESKRMADALIEEVIWDGRGGEWAVPLVPTGSLLLERPRNGVSPPAGGAGSNLLRSVSISAVKAGRFVADESTEKWCEPIDNAAPFVVRAGDAFAVRGNGNRSLVGRVGLAYSTPDPECVYPDLLIRLRFDADQIEPLLATTIWNSTRVHARLLDRAKSSNGIYKVNGKDISSHLLPVPDRAEQGVLVERLRGCDALATAAADHADAAQAAARLVRETLLRGDA